MNAQCTWVVQLHWSLSNLQHIINTRQGKEAQNSRWKLLTTALILAETWNLY